MPSGAGPALTLPPGPVNRPRGRSGGGTLAPGKARVTDGVGPLAASPVNRAATSKARGYRCRPAQNG